MSHPGRLENLRAAFDLHRRIEDHMVRKAADFLKILRLVGRAIRGDLAIVVLGGKQRLPQARGANAIQIFTDHRRDRPHAERLERRQHLDPGRIAQIGQYLEVGAKLRQVHHEGRAVHAGKVEMGEGPRIACSGFHRLLP